MRHMSFVEVIPNLKLCRSRAWYGNFEDTILHRKFQEHVEKRSHERHREKLLTPDEVAVWCSRWSISIKRLGGWPHGNENKSFRKLWCWKTWRREISESLRPKRSKFLLSCFVLSGAFQGEFKHFPKGSQGIMHLSFQEKSKLSLQKHRFQPTYYSYLQKPTLENTNALTPRPVWIVWMDVTLRCAHFWDLLNLDRNAMPTEISRYSRCKDLAKL